MKNIFPTTVGGLRGHKGTLWEGGLRVPAIIEWPSEIKHKISNFPVSTMDIFPTIADIVGISSSDMIYPIDGISITNTFNSNIKTRKAHIPFRFKNGGALIENNFKLVATSIKDLQFELYNLKIDPIESDDIAMSNPELFEELKTKFLKWNESVNLSVEGKDYSGGVLFEQPKSHFWMKDKRYEPYLEEFIKRPEYEKRIIKGK